MRILPLAMLGLVFGAAPALAFDCAALTGTVVPKSAIGLPTSGAKVISASLISDARDGTYCKLLGGIKPVDPTAPDIKFQLNLPERWNGKALQFGGGAWDGVVTGLHLYLAMPGMPQALQQGYVTFGSDSGHQGATTDASFALNSEAFANFLGAQIKKTHDTVMALVGRTYHAPPRQMYFLGESEGGREALIAAERWPADYEGIVSIFPAFDMMAMAASDVRDGQAIFGQRGAWVSPAKLSIVSAKVLAVCDELDGLKDGIIGNVNACRATFNSASLRCPDGLDAGVDCLSDAQLAAVRQLSSSRTIGVTLSGVDSMAPWPILESDTTAGTSIFGEEDDVEKSLAGGLGGGAMRFMAMKNSNYNYMEFDTTAHTDRLQQLSRMMDVTGALAPFAKRGGKLLLVAGTSDMTVPPGNTISFYERLQRAHGANLSGFARFYMVPGMAHAGGGGNFLPGWDYLATLDSWVTKAKAPGPQTITDTNSATMGRTRPLCEYPAYPKYMGTGDANQAASFICTVG